MSRLHETCLFCDPAAHGQANQVLLRSDNFMLFAGLGPIIEGYIIIAPLSCGSTSNDYHSFSELPAALLDEYTFIRNLVSEFYLQAYGQECSMHFEHGRAGVCFPRETETKHCYHAHLCCYPCSYPLWEDMSDLAPITIDGLYELAQAVDGQPYLLVAASQLAMLEPPESLKRKTWITRVVPIPDSYRVPSQYLRRLLAARVGDTDSWDWAILPKMPLVSSLIAAFGTWLPGSTKYVWQRGADGVPKLDFVRSVELSTQIGNDSIAVDFQNTWMGKIQHHALARFIANLPSEKSRRPRVLDVGCGPGLYLNVFQSLGFVYKGIDISAKMTALAQEAVGQRTGDMGENSLAGAAVTQVSLQDYHGDSESFDGIWCSAFLVHTPRNLLANSMSRLADMLTPTGVLYVSVQLGSGSVVRHEGRVFYYYSEDELRAAFNNLHLDVIASWTDETNFGTRTNAFRKEWIHFLLKKQHAPRLGDLGERGVLRVIGTLVPEAAGEDIILGIGDDCAAIVPDKDEVIVVTTDPCPQPVITLLGENDLWYYGWYTMLISLSDLGAMGASAKGIVLALEADNNMLVRDLERFYAGINEAAATYGCPVLGGNVKDAPRFSCVGTAVGSVPRDRLLRRDSALPGEYVVVLGDMGLFWAGVLHRMRSVPLSPEDSATVLGNVRRPIPRIREGAAISRNGLARCAMDSSDGLIACFYQIAEKSGVDICIDLNSVSVHHLVAKVAQAVDIDVRKLMLSWGDWQLVTTVSPDNMPRLEHMMANLSCPLAVVGAVQKGPGNVWLNDGTSRRKLNFIASERFTDRSYFSHGLEGYLGVMRKEPIAG